MSFCSNPQRVAVIGAGVAGLQAARAVRDSTGADVVIFERADDIGGVWRANYCGYGAQVPHEQYCFPELAEKSVGMDWYPSGPQLRAHCHNFAQKFGLWPAVRTNVEVIQIRHIGGSRWCVVSRPRVLTFRREEEGGDDDSTTEEFDLVVLAVGSFSTAFIPEVSGAAAFGGLCLHSSELTDAAALRGRRVVIVGAGKSALDCFVLASKQASTVTLIARAPTWMLPQRFCGIPLRYLASTRWFADLVFPPYYDAGILRLCLGYLMRPLQAILWFVLAPLLWLHFAFLPRALRPTVDLRWQLWHGHSLAICDAGALKVAFRQPTASCVRGQIARFERGEVLVDDSMDGKQKALPADVIVFATGYREAWSKLFDRQTLAALDPRGEGPELYRQILPTAELPGLAFVGRVLSTSDIVSSFVQAQWLSHVVTGRIRCPSTQERHAISERYRAWRRKYLPTTSSTFISAPRVHSYLDELHSDLHPKSFLQRVAALPHRFWTSLLPLRAKTYAAFAKVPRSSAAQHADDLQWVPAYKSMRSSDDAKSVPTTRSAV